MDELQKCIYAEAASLIFTWLKHLRPSDQPLCLCDWGLSLWIYWSNHFWSQPQLSIRATAEFDSSKLAQSFSPWGCSLYNRQFCFLGWCYDGAVDTEVLNLAFSRLPSCCSSTDNEICETNDNSFWHFCLKTRFASHHKKGCLNSIGIFSFE